MAWLPFALCLVLTATASVLVGAAQRQTERARFANEVASARHRIEERMASYVSLLRGSAGLLAHEKEVKEADFHHFVEWLALEANYPGTLGIGYSVRVGPVSVEEATARLRASGWTQISVWPDGPRDEVHSIVLLEPLDNRNQAAIGYDMRTEPVRREAMDRARDSGQVALSGKVTLVQEIEGPKQAGFLVYAPIYEGDVIPSTVETRRERLRGYVYMPLRAGDLLTGVLGDERRQVELALYDGPAAAAAQLLYASRDGAISHRVASETLPIAGHVWTATFVSVAPSHVLAAVLAVAAFGLVLSGIVFFLTWTREQARAREVDAQAHALATEEKLRVKDLFIGMLGHDLRSPLGAITLSADLLDAQCAAVPEVAAIVRRLRSSAARMARMIDQLLDVTRVRLGGGIAVRRRSIDLAAIAHDAVDEVRASTSDRAVELVTTGELCGTWDPDRLAQVFSNLLANAVRHRNGEPVAVTVDGSASSQCTLVVHNCVAIPPGVLSTVFEPFQRSDSTSAGSSSRGLGLGLFISRAIVEAHGGTIEVASTAATGTTFTVRLPRALERAPGDASDRAEPDIAVPLAQASYAAGS